MWKKKSGKYSNHGFLSHVKLGDDWFKALLPLDLIEFQSSRLVLAYEVDSLSASVLLTLVVWRVERGPWVRGLMVLWLHTTLRHLGQSVGFRILWQFYHPFSMYYLYGDRPSWPSGVEIKLELYGGTRVTPRWILYIWMYEQREKEMLKID